MTKVDKLNYDKNGEALPRHFSDALSSLRGFANSKARGSVIFSAGLNPALYSYAAEFPDFFPDRNGHIQKGIVLKVSDHRSAMIQGKFLAKKGLWISEFRIESGLNCGGHAFATNGLVAGPILREFSQQREELNAELTAMCNTALSAKGVPVLPEGIKSRLTYQGGLGTWQEMKFLMDHYGLDGAGWGSPFLLVPEATSVDDKTLNRLIMARETDYYLSDASPLGVPFNNLRTSTSEEQRKTRIEKDRPGSPCYKKFLSFNTEFTDKPICTASRQYINEKIKSLEAAMDAGDALEQAKAEVMQKDCLCEGLGASAILKQGQQPARKLNAVSICPGPNLAYFTGVFTLEEMVGHIYGRNNILNALDRPHFFVKEIQLYMDHLKKEMAKVVEPAKVQKHLNSLRVFKDNLIDSIIYYQSLIRAPEGSIYFLKSMRNQLEGLSMRLNLAVFE